MSHCVSPGCFGVDEHLDSRFLCVSHCPVGVRLHQEMSRLASNNELTVNKVIKLWDDEDEHWVLEHGCEPKKTTHSGNGKYQGAWAFTLTKSPKDDLSEVDMAAAVRKIMNQKSCPTTKFAWYLEYKDGKDHPHIHGMYETEKGGRIEKKHWARAWPIWDERAKLGQGFRGGYHRPVRSDEGYSNYIKKDGGLSESFGLPD